MLVSYSPYHPGFPPYEDRYRAGVELARSLVKYRRRKTLLVLAISGHGVEVALPIAQTLHAQLDLVIAGVLPIPQRPESSFGAIVEDTVVFNDGLAATWGLTPGQIAHIVGDVRDETRHRMRRIRGDRPLPDVRGRTVIITDDGLGVGFQLLAAIEWGLKQKPRDVVVGIPVAPRYDVERFTPLVSEVVCPIQTEASNVSIAAFYRRWKEPTDDEVRTYLSGGRWSAAG